jgi:cholesterol transport system auxiliary component
MKHLPPHAERRPRLLALASLACTVLGLAACSSGLRSGAAEPVTYVLRAAPVASASGQGSAAPGTPAAVDASHAGASPGAAPAAAARLAGVTLQVTRVLAQPGYAGDRILLVRPDRSLDFFAASRWPEPLPAVVATLAAETLRGTGALRAVHDDAAPFSADYSLRIAIRRFDAEYTNGAAAPRVRVAVECTVGRASNRAVLGAFDAETTVDAGGNRMGAVVEAFEQAAQAVMSVVAARTLDVVAADAAAAPASR